MSQPCCTFHSLPFPSSTGYLNTTHVLLPHSPLGPSCQGILVPPHLRQAQCHQGQDATAHMERNIPDPITSHSQGPTHCKASAKGTHF